MHCAWKYSLAVAISPASGTPPVGPRPGRPTRFTTPPWLITAAGLFAAVAAGMALVRDLRLGLAIMGACAFVPLVLLNLPLALAAWIPLAWNEYSHVASKAPLAGILMLLVAWIATRRDRSAVVTSERSIRIARTAFVLLLIWVTLSVSWASDRSDAWSEVIQWLLAGATFLLVTTVVTTPARARLIVVAFITGALASVIIGLTGSGLSTTANTIDLATRQRFSGGASDPNYLAAGLIAAISLAVGLIASSRDPLARLGLLGAVLSLAAAMAATQSRGGLVAAAVTIVVALALARERRAQTAAFVVLAIAGMTTILLLSPVASQRLTTFDAGGTGRTELWQVAWRVASDHPVIGVGVRGFQHEAKAYVLEPGALTSVENIAEREVVAHNIYLQQLADTGIVGLLLLLAVCIACLTTSQIAAARFRAAGDRAMVALATATTVAMTGMLTASAFISNSTDKRLWIVLALGPALLVAAPSGGIRRLSQPGQSGSARLLEGSSQPGSLPSPSR